MSYWQLCFLMQDQHSEFQLKRQIPLTYSLRGRRSLCALGVSSCGLMIEPNPRLREPPHEPLSAPEVTESSQPQGGRMPGGVAAESFDREGVSHRELTLIDSGIAASLMHNSYTALAMGVANTAHSSGSARSLPGISPTNLSIKPGDVSKDELIGDIKQGLLVNRSSGSSNPISADFSGVAKAAYLMKDGKLNRPVTGTLIAGNAFDARKTLSGVSSETERTFTATLPFLRLEGISVTAN